jgi:membrane-associated phospholipid phosphatase
VITVFWKISIHTAAFAASVVAFAIILDLRLLLLLLLLLPLAWARVRLHHPTGVQTLAGGLLGGLSTALQFAVYPG